MPHTAMENALTSVSAQKKQKFKQSVPEKQQKKKKKQQRKGKQQWNVHGNVKYIIPGCFIIFYDLNNARYADALLDTEFL